MLSKVQRDIERGSMLNLLQVFQLGNRVFKSIFLIQCLIHEMMAYMRYDITVVLSFAFKHQCQVEAVFYPLYLGGIPFSFLLLFCVYMAPYPLKEKDK